MSNFINESERHAELYGKYTSRQQHILEIVEPLRCETVREEQLIKALHILGLSDAEISWLKRMGHVLPACI